MMADSVRTERRCPTCGEAHDPGAQVCTSCHSILVAPDGRARTPGWVVGLLVGAIVVLLAYAGFLAYRVFVLHIY